MVSSTLGSPTKTGWKRRSRAASFSTCLRYSSRVVAPMQRSSPRARAGLSMLAASAAPSAAPAPTMVCSSSMNRMIWPSASATSRSTALSRSSNSPRYLLPAIRAPMSRDTRRRSFRVSGTSPATMRWARPSAMAVLPTPGSPISTGLFLVRRESTCTTRRISSSRPTTGSILPLRATSVRSRPNFSRAWYLDSGSGSVTRAPPRTAARALSRASRSAPLSRRARPAALDSSAAMASSRCSVETYSSRSCSASAKAASSTLAVLRASCDWAPPATLAMLSSSSSRRPARPSIETPSFWSTGTVLPSGCPIRARSRCAGRISAWPRLLARDWASARAS